ncbi:MAG: tetratricopeptide repeat protein [Limnohabitans sp.]|nr:tetratricopeptide repeat protein [Limnohabitans sp.]
MSTHLDLEEQEQFDQFKHFWNRWGSLITGLLTVVLLIYAGWNGWNYWQQRQASQASLLYDTFEKAVREKDDALMARSLSDLQDQFTRSTVTQQAALLAARIYADKNQLLEVEKSLQWVISQDRDPGFVAVARLRLSALEIQRKNLDKAASLVQGQQPPAGFQPLFEDRLGDIAVLQKKTDDAKAHFLKAWQGMEETNDYRRLIEIKLAALGVNPKDSGS